MTKRNELPDLLNAVKALVREQGTTMSALSRALKKEPSYVNRNLHKRDPSVGFVTALSTVLGVNLFDLYGQNLPADMRHTETEQALRAENEALRKELESTRAERDRYWGVIAGRVGN